MKKLYLSATRPFGNLVMHYLQSHSFWHLFSLNFEMDVKKLKVPINISFYDTKCKIPRDFTNGGKDRDNDPHKRGLTAGTFSLEIN